MLKILKIEMNRAIHSIGMLISLLIGMGCILYQVIPIIQKMEESKKLWESMGMYRTFTRGGFYNFWFPSYIDGSTLYYFYFIGIIVALPFGISYYRDKKSGLIKNICNRVNKKKYLAAKYIATFISGGIAAALPIIVDFLIVRLIIPVDCFDINGTVLNAITEWGVFIIDNPYLAAAIIVCLWFVFGGALATVSLMVSSVSNNFFTIQLAPFFVMLLLFYMPTFLPVYYNRFFPYYFLTLFGRGNPIIALVESLFIILITYGVFVTIESRRDVL